MVITRAWVMPDPHTFSIGPIADLLRYEMRGGLWIDPFANSSRVADVTNDLNPEFDTDYHMDALDFLKQFDDESIDGVLYDPPYSPRQVSECYKMFGVGVTSETTRSSYYSRQKDEIQRIVKTGGKCISFGWNSNGMGMNRMFELERILIVAHGGNHNDTICTVETKTASQRRLELDGDR